MAKRTPLYDQHLQQNGLMVDFAGWEMPLHYGSQIEEHHQVRGSVGMFDVSHMGVVEVEGEDACAFLRFLLANNIDKLKTPGKALYTCLLNPEGGIIDDLIVYYLAPMHYRLVINAGTTDTDLNWINAYAKSFSVKITHRQDLAMLAVQGPNAREKVALVLPGNLGNEEKLSSLKSFQFFIDQNGWLIARTGYTGEDGVEIILPNDEIISLWKSLLQIGVHPIGLGARDTLRLEAGLNLYGQDMDETVTPFESNLEWTVAFDPTDRMFVGRDALTLQKKMGIQRQLVGLRLLDKGILRHHQRVMLQGNEVGEITSGSFSPTLKQSIGLARIHLPLNSSYDVMIRTKCLKVERVQPPFI